MKKYPLFLVVCSAAALLPAAELYPISEVRVAETSVFDPAVKADCEYMLALDCDMLLAPFLREAGLPKKAESYGNWENCGLDGHTLGHYLSALSNMIASGNDPDGELKRRLVYLVDELERCQNAAKNGRLDGIPKSPRAWRKLRENDIEPLGKLWVPWYNIHKTFAGLRDAYEIAGVKKAKSVLVKLADWTLWVTEKLDDETFQKMLDQEFGGMNEVFADVYALTGEKKYLDAAYRWEHRKVIDPLYAHEDKLTGLHANTQIPKFGGLARTAELTGDERRWDACDFVWHTIVNRRSVAFGGNSVNEHFHALDSFAKLMADREGPETCNTYNMLRLTERLFAHEPKAEYAAYYERALFNHLLSAINVKTPGFVYFTPTRPDHYRVYSTPTNCFWCCVGTGMENPGKYGKFIYAHEGDNVLYVNLYIDSELKGVLRQTTDFPESGKTVIEFLKDFTGTVYIREGDKYARHDGAWKRGEKLTASRPMDYHVEMLPDGSAWGAIMKGPIVMGKRRGTENLLGLFADGSRMGHVAYGPLVKANEVEYYKVGEPIRIEGLVPFYQLQECRYQIYWEFLTDEQIAERKARLAAEEARRIYREEHTVDSLQPGEQQPETEHDMFAVKTSTTGFYHGEHCRAGKHFGYFLDAKGEKNLTLEIDMWGRDKDRDFDILVNGVRIGTVKQDGQKDEDFYSENFPIPEAALAAGDRLKVEFVDNGARRGAVIFGLRLMRR